MSQTFAWILLAILVFSFISSGNSFTAGVGKRKYAGKKVAQRRELLTNIQVFLLSFLIAVLSFLDLPGSELRQT